MMSVGRSRKFVLFIFVTLILVLSMTCGKRVGATEIDLMSDQEICSLLTTYPTDCELDRLMSYYHDTKDIRTLVVLAVNIYEPALDAIIKIASSNQLKERVRAFWLLRFYTSCNNRKAVEAAAEGWLQALVVEDMEVVRVCAETLKRAKIGRVKLLPLSNLKNIKTVKNPNIPGILGPATMFVECSTRYQPAVNFVLGDTLIASDEKTALIVSEQGYRVVTVDGEVFEPGLRLEVGFYREPIDLSEILPSEETIKRISETVNSFEKLLDGRKSDLKRLSNELVRLESEKIAHEDNIKFFERDLVELRQNLERVHKNLVEVNRKIRSLNHKYEKSKTWIFEAETRQKQIEQRLHVLRVEAANLRKKLKPETITNLEAEKAKLETEINELQRQFDELKTRLTMHNSNLENVLLPSLNTTRREILGIGANLRKRNKDFEMATEKLKEVTEKLEMLEKEKEELTVQMMAKREEHKKYANMVEELNKQIRKINNEMEPYINAVNDLKQELLRYQIELDHNLKELQTLGYENPDEAWIENYLSLIHI